MEEMHGRLEMPLQLPTERHAMIGRLWETGFKHVMELEQELMQQSTVPSIDDVRQKADKCVFICMQGMLGTYKVVSYYDGAPQLAREDTKARLFPTPLRMLLLELGELHKNRPSRLLSHHQVHGASEGPYNLIRRVIQAKAVASVQIIKETGLSYTDATKLVANTLNDSPFSKPGDAKKSKKYSAATINDWRKRARDKKGEFTDIVLQQRQELDSLVHILRERQYTDEEIRVEVLKHLSSFILAISYRDE